MAIETIKKIYLLGYKEIENEVISLLQELGIVEISEVIPETTGLKVESTENGKLNEKIEQLKYPINFLEEHLPREGPFENTGKERIFLSKEELRKIVENFDFVRIYQDCKSLEKKLDELKVKRSKLENEKHQIIPWLTLGTKLKNFVPTAKVGIKIGHLSLAQYNRFEKEIPALAKEITLSEINTDKKWKYVVLLYSNDYSAAVEEILKKFEFIPFFYPLVDLSPREIFDQINQELQNVEKEEKDISTALGKLLSYRPKLKVLYDYYANLQFKEKIKRFLNRTRESFCLTGWISTKEMNKVKEILFLKFSYLEIIFAEPEEKDKVPIILKNKKVVEPFEVVTDLYGRPTYRGIDPTPYLSIFFAIFFGLCLTDAGYGIVLMLLSGLVLWKYAGKMGEMSKKFFRLFFLGGVATLLLGAMVGGWFGITVKLKLFDPLEDLLIFFALSLGLGIIHIFTGLAIKMGQNIESGDWTSAFCDQALWITIISSLVTYGLVRGKMLPSPVEIYTKLGALGSALGIILFQGRRVDKNLFSLTGFPEKIYPWLWLVLTVSMTFFLSKLFLPASRYFSIFSFLLILILGRKNLKNVFGRIGLGLYSLYGISSFLGDTLSYSRLVALGLTTGIVAMIINRMAGIAYQTPYIGFIIAFFILLIGHIFNIAINLLGAFVHSCRLQYVEFFTKFYEAGGRPFKPFRIENKYSILKSYR